MSLDAKDIGANRYLIQRREWPGAEWTSVAIIDVGHGELAMSLFARFATDGPGDWTLIRESEKRRTTIAEVAT